MTMARRTGIEVKERTKRNAFKGDRDTDKKTEEMQTKQMTISTRRT